MRLERRDEGLVAQHNKVRTSETLEDGRGSRGRLRWRRRRARCHSAAGGNDLVVPGRAIEAEEIDVVPSGEESHGELQLASKLNVRMRRCAVAALVAFPHFRAPNATGLLHLKYLDLGVEVGLARAEDVLLSRRCVELEGQHLIPQQLALHRHVAAEDSRDVRNVLRPPPPSSAIEQGIGEGQALLQTPHPGAVLEAVESYLLQSVLGVLHHRQHVVLDVQDGRQVREEQIGLSIRQILLGFELSVVQTVDLDVARHHHQHILVRSHGRRGRLSVAEGHQRTELEKRAIFRLEQRARGAAERERRHAS
mmetsp:Transcript_9659/g.36267  ORF Transcript_9659/g.36267 Transcript_9659/m.36267 type:complete len:308 (+) Transcript_9659:6088-7011(+)